jgi:hypothetical protein
MPAPPSLWYIHNFDTPIACAARDTTTYWPSGVQVGER